MTAVGCRGAVASVCQKRFPSARTRTRREAFPVSDSVDRRGEHHFRALAQIYSHGARRGRRVGAHGGDVLCSQHGAAAICPHIPDIRSACVLLAFPAPCGMAARFRRVHECQLPLCRLGAPRPALPPRHIIHAPPRVESGVRAVRANARAGGSPSPSRALCPVSGPPYPINTEGRPLLCVRSLILKEHLTPAKISGAFCIVLGGGISVGGTPTDAPTEFNVTQVSELVVEPAGIAFIICLLSLALASALAVKLFERSYELDEEEEEERNFRLRTLASTVLAQGQQSIIHCKTPAEMRWKKAMNRALAEVRVTAALNAAAAAADRSRRESGGRSSAGVMSPQLEAAPSSSPPQLEAAPSSLPPPQRAQQQAQLQAHAPAPPNGCASERALSYASDEFASPLSATDRDGVSPDDSPTAEGLKAIAFERGSGTVSAAAVANGAAAPAPSYPPAAAPATDAAAAAAILPPAENSDAATAAAMPSPPPSPPSAPLPAAITSEASRWADALWRPAAHAEVSRRPAATSKARPRRQVRKPPAWLNSAMAIVYPASLGLLEGVTQLTMKGIMGMGSLCFQAEPRPWPGPCYELPTLWLFVAVFALVGVMTVIWLKIVYTRYETTEALPIEYGTVHACSVLAGFLFFRERDYMDAQMRIMTFIGLAVVIVGVGLSSCRTLPCERRAKQARRVRPAAPSP